MDTRTSSGSKIRVDAEIEESEKPHLGRRKDIVSSSAR